MGLEDLMITAIESVKNRIVPRDKILLRAKHYGFVWGIYWTADKLGYKRAEEVAKQIMMEIEEELKEAS